MLKKGPFADIFRVMYIPQWRVAAAERKLKALAAEGYEPVSFAHIGFSFYRVQLQCTSPQNKDYYLYARFQGGKGPTLGFDSPCGEEKRKTALISHTTISITSCIYAAELKTDADPAVVFNHRQEKLRAARKLYLSFLLFELSMPLITFLVFFLIVPHEIFFREPITISPSLYPFVVFPIYAAVGTFVLTKELKQLHNSDTQRDDTMG